MQRRLKVRPFFFLSTQVLCSACDIRLNRSPDKSRAGPQQGPAAKPRLARHYCCDSRLAPWLGALAALRVSPTSCISLLLPGSFTHGKSGAQEVFVTSRGDKTRPSTWELLAAFLSCTSALHGQFPKRSKQPKPPKTDFSAASGDGRSSPTPAVSYPR